MKNEILCLHTMITDKSDYRHSQDLNWVPTEHMTKDYIRKVYEEKQR